MYKDLKPKQDSSIFKNTAKENTEEGDAQTETSSNYSLQQGPSSCEMSPLNNQEKEFNFEQISQKFLLDSQIELEINSTNPVSVYPKQFLNTIPKSKISREIMIFNVEPDKFLDHDYIHQYFKNLFYFTSKLIEQQYKFEITKINNVFFQGNSIKIDKYCIIIKFQDYLACQFIYFSLVQKMYIHKEIIGQNYKPYYFQRKEQTTQNQFQVIVRNLESNVTKEMIEDRLQKIGKKPVKIYGPFIFDNLSNCLIVMQSIEDCEFICKVFQKLNDQNKQQKFQIKANINLLSNRKRSFKTKKIFQSNYQINDNVDKIQNKQINTYQEKKYEKNDINDKTENNKKNKHYNHTYFESDQSYERSKNEYHSSDKNQKIILEYEKYEKKKIIIQQRNSSYDSYSYNTDKKSKKISKKDKKYNHKDDRHKKYHNIKYHKDYSLEKDDIRYHYQSKSGQSHKYDNNKYDRFREYDYEKKFSKRYSRSNSNRRSRSRSVNDKQEKYKKNLQNLKQLLNLVKMIKSQINNINLKNYIKTNIADLYFIYYQNYMKKTIHVQRLTDFFSLKKSSQVKETPIKTSQGQISQKNIKLSSWNINGIRAITKKGEFQNYIKKCNPDIICLNELKITQEKFDQENIQQYFQKEIYPYQYFNLCKPPIEGYSGVAILSKFQPSSIIYDFNQQDKHHNEGRVITLEFDNFYIVSTYTPNSGATLDRLKYRTEEWDIDFRNFLSGLKKVKKVILTGDLNCAHNEIDLKNPSTNHKSAGFTDEERREFTNLLESGFVDIYRNKFPEEKKYTFWGYRGGQRQKNIGWRLDYFLLSDNINLDSVISININNAIMGSDHCPVELELNLEKF